jgi:hypothetical protein
MLVRSARSASCALALDGVVLALVQPPGLEQHGARDDDLAHVVEQPGERRLGDGATVQAGRVGELDGHP